MSNSFLATTPSVNEQGALWLLCSFTGLLKQAAKGVWLPL